MPIPVAPAHGTTAKFDCVLPTARSSRSVRPHRRDSRRTGGEPVADRLGFGADRMYLIPRVRCYGCLRTPSTRTCARPGAPARDRDRHRTGRPLTPTSSGSRRAALSRREIRNGGYTRWLAWYELESIDDPSAPRIRSSTRCALPRSCWRTGTTRREPAARLSVSGRRRCVLLAAVRIHPGSRRDIRTHRSISITGKRYRFGRMPHGASSACRRCPTAAHVSGHAHLGGRTPALVRELAMLNDTQIGRVCGGALPGVHRLRPRADPNAWARRSATRSARSPTPAPALRVVGECDLHVFLNFTGAPLMVAGL